MIEISTILTWIISLIFINFTQAILFLTLIIILIKSSKKFKENDNLE